MVCEKKRDVPTTSIASDPPLGRRGMGPREGHHAGADNGIGVAAALAAATDPSVEHGPLELLFTIDEETGLTGATKLDPSLLRGRTLLQSRLGGRRGPLRRMCRRSRHAPPVGPGLVSPCRGSVGHRVEVLGLTGGHSGGTSQEPRERAQAASAGFSGRDGPRALNSPSRRFPAARSTSHSREAEAVLDCLPVGESLQGVIASMTVAFRRSRRHRRRA